MKYQISGILTILCLMLTTNTVLANHELVVTPERHTGQTDRYDKRRTDRRSQRTHQQAQQPQYRRPYLTTYFGGGFGSGGEVVGRFTDNFGDTDRVRSGGGFYVEGGLLATLDTSTLLRVTAGFETDRVDRSNGLASFDRTRFDLTLLRNFGGFELGVGLTAHVGVDFDCSINSICANGTEFDNALGYTVEYALTSFNRWSGYGSRSRHDSRRNPLRTARLGLRFTGIEYTPTFGVTAPANDEELDGNSLSLFIGFSL